MKSGKFLIQKPLLIDPFGGIRLDLLDKDGGCHAGAQAGCDVDVVGYAIDRNQGLPQVRNYSGDVAVQFALKFQQNERLRIFYRATW